MKRILVLLLLSTLAFARDVRVTTEPQLRAAISGAQPGDVITIANGTYAIASKLSCTVAGTAALPIVVRGEQPSGATLESDTVIAIGVSAPFWRFEDFAIDPAASERQHANTTADFVVPAVAALEQRPQSRAQWIELAAQQARLEALEQVLDFEQRIDFGGAEPDAGQLGDVGVRIQHVSLALA